MKFNGKKSHWLFWILIVFTFACTKKQSKEHTEEHMVQSAVPAPQQVLHKTFSLQKYESFDLEVPPHCMRPRLFGDFHSFRYGEQGNRASDDAASIDVLLLDEQQFNDFTQGSGDATTRSITSAHEQKIDWALPSTYERAQKYHLVFNNSTGKPKTKIVESDLTLSFD